MFDFRLSLNTGAGKSEGQILALTGFGLSVSILCTIVGHHSFSQELHALAGLNRESVAVLKALLRVWGDARRALKRKGES